MVNPARPDWLHWLETCPSTNTWAIAHTQVLRDGDVVFTPHQTAGRGRQGRTWHSPQGVLTASFILDRVLPAYQPLLSLAAGLAVLYAVEDLLPACQSQLQIKWPNDVLLQGRKLAGILCETATALPAERVVVGIGLNRCADLKAMAQHPGGSLQPISLHEVVATVPEPLPLLERLRHYLREAVGFLHPKAASNFAALLPALRARDALMGQSILLDLGGEQLLGRAAGISDRGYLQLELPDGSHRDIATGHVLIRS